MSETQAMFALLRQSADADVVDAIERLVAEAPDRKLARINPLAFAAEHGLDEERVIAAFLHAAKIGIFDMSWNVLCPGCGGVLDSNTTLKTVHSEAYTCSLCAADYEPTLDADGGGDLHRQPARPADRGAQPGRRCRRWNISGSSISARSSTLPEDFEALWEAITLESLDLPAGEKAIISLQLPAEVHHRLRPGHAHRAVHRREGRADEGAAGVHPHLRERPCSASRRWRCGRGRCGFPSRTAPSESSCRPSSSPTTICTT